jgi:predicted PurR-regulated permease PerM
VKNGVVTLTAEVDSQSKRAPGVGRGKLLLIMVKPPVSQDTSGVRTAAILAAVIAALYLGREIFIPLAFAITLTLIMAPAVTWLQKLRLGRIPSVVFVTLVAVAIAGGISWVIFNEVVEVVNDLPSYQQNIHNKIEAMQAPIKGAFGRAAANVQELSKELSSAPAPIASPATAGRRNTPISPARPTQVQIVAEPANELEYVFELAAPILAPLGIFAIVLVFSMFLMIKQADLRDRLFRLAGLDRLNVMTQALDDATRRVSRYLMLQLLVNATFGVLCGTGLYLIGVPYAALWGAVAGILRIVPFAGSLVATSLPLLLSLAVFDHWMQPVLVFLLFATMEVAIGNFVEPWLYGMHTGISSLALLLTTVFWAALWGPAGLILATPLTVCVVVLGRHIPQLSFLHILLGDQPVLAPDAQVYQRLLAMDDQDARAVADGYLGENSLVQLYDSVIIPALTMAEQDRHKGALDPAREEFVFLSVREMIAEFYEKTATWEPMNLGAARDDESRRKPEVAASRILCLPANDEADEIAAAMLAQLLEQSGCIALSFPPDPSLEHVVAIVEPAQTDVFCVSAVPPFAFARARTLSQLLQARFPRTRIVIGIWGFTGDTEKALHRFQPARPDRLVTNLAEAVRFFVDPTQAAKDSLGALSGQVS